MKRAYDIIGFAVCILSFLFSLKLLGGNFDFQNMSDQEMKDTFAFAGLISFPVYIAFVVVRLWLMRLFPPTSYIAGMGMILAGLLAYWTMRQFSYIPADVTEITAGAICLVGMFITMPGVRKLMEIEYDSGKNIQ